MFRLNKLTDYAVVLPGHMARHAGEGEARMNAANLAVSTSINEPTVAKLLKDLSRAGLVGATRGATGGYGLLRKGDDITVRQVIEAIEGPIALTECIEGSGGNCLARGCGMRGNWDQVNHAIIAALEAVTLTDMMRAEKRLAAKLHTIEIPAQAGNP